MTLPPIGDARLNLAQKHAALDQHNAETLLQIAKDTGDTPIVTKILSLLGDERQLRGIPIIGRSVRGAIAHTIPGSWTPSASRATLHNGTAGRI